MCCRSYLLWSPVTELSRKGRRIEGARWKLFFVAALLPTNQPHTGLTPPSPPTSHTTHLKTSCWASAAGAKGYTLLSRVGRRRVPTSRISTLCHRADLFCGLQHVCTYIYTLSYRVALSGWTQDGCTDCAVRRARKCFGRTY